MKKYFTKFGLAATVIFVVLASADPGRAQDREEEPAKPGSRQKREFLKPFTVTPKLDQRLNGREAFIVVTLGGEKARGAARGDIRQAGQLSVAYARAGYRVHVFQSLSTWEPYHRALATVASAYRTNDWQLEALAFHYAGHGTSDGVKLRPLNPDGTQIAMPRSVYTHHAIGSDIASNFSDSDKRFQGVFFTAVFDACFQGTAPSQFPKGLKGSGQSKAQGAVMTSSRSGQYCGLGEYSPAFAKALKFPTKKTFRTIYRKAHNGGASAISSSGQNGFFHFFR